MVLSKTELRRTCMWQRILAQRPGCGAPLGAQASGAGSRLRSRPRCINETSVPKAGRKRLLLEGGAEARGALSVRKPVVECCEGSKRNVLKTATGASVQERDGGCGTAGVGESKGSHFWHCLLQRLAVCCCEAGQGGGGHGVHRRTEFKYGLP